MDSNSEDTSGLPASCALCLRILTSDNDASDTINMCSDCKFLLLEDLDSPIRDASARSWQRTSSRTTPSGSRRWRRVLSDTESDGIDSVFGESESNVSFSGYRVMYGENETISYSAYGGGSSNASVDGSSILGIENSADEGSDLDDTDTDIDPMRAGMYHWNSDDQEDDDNGSQRRSVNLHESTLGRLGILSAEIEGTIDLRFQERFQAHMARISNDLVEFAGISIDLEDLGLRANFVDVDYLDSQRIDELVEHLAEADGLRRGAPPAAVSVVNSLPRVVIKDHKLLDDSLACAICKDSLFIGSVVNQLPCSHLYHPSCILPWLSSRNTCPLCRYELPTDDQEYEDRKQRNGNEFVIHETQQHDTNEDNSSDVNNEFGEEIARSGPSAGPTRGRWFFLAAAAPVISVVGFALMFWLGNQLTEQRRSSIVQAFCSHGERLNHHPPHSQRRRRWWSPF